MVGGAVSVQIGLGCIRKVPELEPELALEPESKASNQVLHGLCFHSCLLHDGL